MTVYYNEIDPFAAAWLAELMKAGAIPTGEIDTRSIEDVHPTDLAGFQQCHFFAGIGVWAYALRLAGVSDDYPIWTGSCPCQPFSTAGKGKGVADERHLWPALHHLISVCRPERVFGEQVASKDGLGWLDLVSTDLEALGYACGAVPFPAAGIGAPHIRQRLYWVADADDRRKRLVGGCVSEMVDGQSNVSPSGLGRGGSSCRVADADDSGSQGRGIGGNGAGQCASRSGGLAGGVANAAGIGRIGRWAGQAGDESGAVQRPERFCDAGKHHRPGPTHGVWRDADWLGCRDGFWRPVEPVHVKMVDGPAPDMGYLCNHGASGAGYAQEKEEVSDPQMQELRETAGAKEVLKRSSGITEHDGKAEVLRPRLHGRVDGRDDQGDELTQLAPSIHKGSEGKMRDLRSDGAPASASSGSEPVEQRGVELEDVVRFLSPSLSLSKLYGDRRTETALRALRDAVCEAGDVRDASVEIAAIWQSVGKEAQDRIRLGFDASRWEKVVPSPLINNADARVGRLRGYGNAIVAHQAAAFIEVFLERETVGLKPRDLLDIMEAAI